MTLNTLIPFLLAVLAMELTPGPNMAYLALVAARSGRRAGAVAVAGVTLGLGAYLLASVAGLAEAAQRWPWAYQALRWAGVAYLFWLAFDAWREAPPKAQADGVQPFGRIFVRGLVANLLNPKAALLYVTLLPAFIAPDGDPVTQALILGSIHIGVSLVIHGSIVLFAGSARELMARQGPWTGRIMALALASVAIWLVFATA
ncbi:MAG: LysE family translocator [Phenylobacterium sp.]|uniref:LysE family translocator n=1 Tax=Phenylobacterium sp. TaxID=1871053 RepID=UPI001208C248|nr:LysE family translocator [Phenylobacterium sp.]TAL30047.1 MAG: LysE family translocator [Phenylobacterium sp.]